MAGMKGGRPYMTVHGWSYFRLPGAGGAEADLATPWTATAFLAEVEEARSAAPGTGPAEGAAAAASGTGSAARAPGTGTADALGAGSVEDEEAPGTGALFASATSHCASHSAVVGAVSVQAILNCKWSSSIFTFQSSTLA